jgi:hypothetical protein
VFTQYTDTMDFLRDFLAERMDVPIGCFSGRGGETRDASGTWVRCTKERIKRLLRESVRPNLAHLKPGRYVLIARRGCVDAPLAPVSRSFLSLAGKLGLLESPERAQA